MASKQDLLDQLQALKIFPKTKLVKELRNQIKKKLDRIERKPKPIIKQRQANQSRSIKLKRYHRYIKLIRNNFPQFSHRDIRKQFSKRRQGTDVSIPDAVWQNPSP